MALILVFFYKTYTLVIHLFNDEWMKDRDKKQLLIFSVSIAVIFVAVALARSSIMIVLISCLMIFLVDNVHQLKKARQT